MKLKIISNPRKKWAGKLVPKIKKFLVDNGHRIVRKGADATICVGGDGTILYSHHQKRLQGPVLAIGSKRSYICQLERSSWRRNILHALKGKTRKLMNIRAAVGKKHFSALNDFVVHAKTYRVVGITVSYDGKSASFRGDGIIVSTALGSAAYAYSAGGKQLPAAERRLSIVPICPYRRTFSPVIVPQNTKITIKTDEDCAFIIDGIFHSVVKKGQKVNIQKGVDVLFFEGVGQYH